MKIIISIILAFAIGVTTQQAGIPVPAPPALIGALLVLAMTLGYIVADKMEICQEAKNRYLCGGPTGDTK